MLKIHANNNGVKALKSSLHTFMQQQLLHSSSKSPPSLATYLVESLGFSEKQSVLTSAKLTRLRLAQNTTPNSCKQFTFFHNAEIVINFFNQLGLHRSQIQKVIFIAPKILLSDVDKTLKPKIRVLQELGLSSSDLGIFLSRNPTILFRGLDSAIMPAILALKNVLGNDEDVVKVIRKLWLKFGFSFVTSRLVYNYNLALNCGIPKDLAKKCIVHVPSLFVLSEGRLEELMIRVERELEIPRNSRMFLYGIQLLYNQKEETRESKFEVFRKFGWTQCDIKTLIRNNPLSLVYSKERIEKSLDFVMGELRFTPAMLAAAPCLLMYSLEKRLVPRHRIFLILKEKGLIKKECSYYAAICLPELKFVKKFVLPFEEVHDVYSEYTGRSLQLLCKGGEDTCS